MFVHPKFHRVVGERGRAKEKSGEFADVHGCLVV